MTMRVADAILLGSTTMKCRAGGGFGTSSVGCALEFALAAVENWLEINRLHAEAKAKLIIAQSTNEPEAAHDR